MYFINNKKPKKTIDKIGKYHPVALGGSSVDCLQLTTARPNLLSASETLGNWTDGRILVGTRRPHICMLTTDLWLKTQILDRAYM